MYFFREFDLFDFYRFVLAVLAGTYGVVRTLATAVQILDYRGTLFGSPVLRRYAVVLLLRTPLRRLVYELVVLGGLLGLLIVLIRLHWR